MTETTDPQDELFDILDSEGNPTGVAKPRGEVHRDGDWHRGLHVWIYGYDKAGQPFVLFQRRSMSKDTWPSALDVAVGGHFRAGETLEDTLRETEEEIGLRATVDDLVLLGKRFIEDHGSDYVDRELDEVFALRCDQPLSAYTLHPEEVDGIVALDLDDIRELFKGTVESVVATEYHRIGGWTTFTVGLRDFAGDRPRYRNAAIAGITSIVEGKTPEPFLLHE